LPHIGCIGSGGIIQFVTSIVPGLLPGFVSGSGLSVGFPSGLSTGFADDHQPKNPICFSFH